MHTLYECCNRSYIRTHIVNVSTSVHTRSSHQIGGLYTFHIHIFESMLCLVQEKTKRLSGKIKAQAQEITELRRRSVTPSSETSDISFTTPKQHSTSESRLSTSDELDIPGDEVSY